MLLAKMVKIGVEVCLGLGLGLGILSGTCLLGILVEILNTHYVQNLKFKVQVGAGIINSESI